MKTIIGKALIGAAVIATLGIGQAWPAAAQEMEHGGTRPRAARSAPASTDGFGTSPSGFSTSPGGISTSPGGIGTSPGGLLP